MVQDKVVEELGLVMRLRRNGIVVLVPRFGIEGNIFLIDNDARKAGACGHTPVLVPCMAVTGCVFDFRQAASPRMYSPTMRTHRPLPAKPTPLKSSRCLTRFACRSAWRRCAIGRRSSCTAL